MATVKVSGNKDDVQQVMDDVWTGRCGFGESSKVTHAIILPRILNAGAAARFIQERGKGGQKVLKN